MVKASVKYLIAGAGPTGLGAAYTLKTLGEKDFLVLEKGGSAGGLASSYRDETGFTWDIGGHVHFSHYGEYSQMLDDVLPQDSWSTLARESWIWMRGRFVPYPLQHHLHFLPLKDGARTLVGMLVAAQKDTPKDFYAWMRGNFGNPLTELFMLPYNRKVWAHEPSEMGFGWVGERVMVPGHMRAVIDFLLRKKDPSWGPNATFRFPKAGGTGSIWSALADTIGKEHFAYNQEISSIDSDKHELRTTNGDVYEYEALLSTMPLDLLARMTPTLPKTALDAAHLLAHATTHVVGLGLSGEAPEHLKNKSWMYFPEDSVPFYRATVFSNYSTSHTPDPARFWSLMTETSAHSRMPRGKEELEEATMLGAASAGLISPQNIVSIWSFTAPYGYPVPTLRRDEALGTLLPLLEEKNIFSRGRFGGWKYEVGNQDHSYMQGAEWARRMLRNEAEETLFYPSRVNTGTPRS